MNEATDRPAPNRVHGLRQRARLYRERYGRIEALEPLDRLDHSLATRVARIEQLRRMADEIDAEIKAFELEIAGIERGIEAMLGTVLPEIAARFDEAWSPTPITGYRLWAMREGKFHGVRTHWPSSRMSAECETTGNGDDIPHSDGRCGRLGCGIYAAKQASSLLEEFAPALNSSFAAGLVGLEGKVVEHERGYRGANATVLALAAIDDMHAELTADPDRIEALFDGAPIRPGTTRLPDRRSLFEAIVSYLSTEEKERNPWTSVNRNGSSK